MSTLDFLFRRMKHKVGGSVFRATMGKAKAGTDLLGRFNGLLLCSSGGIHYVICHGHLALKETNI